MTGEQAHAFMSLAPEVTKSGREETEFPRAPPFPSRDDATDIILPKWLYIKDRNGRYLTERSGPVYSTLTFRDGDPDLACAFQATGGTAWYSLFAASGRSIVRFYNWYSSDGTTSPSFNPISSTGNYVYLRDNYGPSQFLSNEQNNSGSPVAHAYLNDSSLFEIVQASIRNDILDVQYQVNQATVIDVSPIIALSTFVRNDSDATVSENLAYTYEKWSVGTWNNTASVEIGMKTTFEAGVPLVADAKHEISISASYSHQWGGQEGTREIVTSSTTVVVPPKKKARATIIVRNAKLDVPFAYTQRVLWTNGVSEDIYKTGIYNNVDSWHVDVVLDNWEDV